LALDFNEIRNKNKLPSKKLDSREIRRKNNLVKKTDTTGSINTKEIFSKGNENLTPQQNLSRVLLQQDTNREIKPLSFFPNNNDSNAGYIGNRAISGLYSVATGIESANKMIDNKDSFGFTDIKEKGKNDIRKQTEELSRAGQNKSKLVKFAGDVAEGTAQAIPTILASVGSGGILGVPLVMSTVAGNNYEQAKREGATHAQAVKYGLASGIAEGAIEALIGGIPGMKGVADPLIDGATKSIKSQVTKAIAKRGLDALGEGVEEGLSTAIDPLIRRGTFDTEAKTTLGEIANNFLVGATTSAVLQTYGGITDVKSNNQVSKEAKSAEIIANAMQSGKSYEMVKNKPVEKMEASEQRKLVETIRSEFNLDTSKPADKFYKIPKDVLENERIFDATGVLPEPSNKIILEETKQKLPIRERINNIFDKLYKETIDNVSPTKKISQDTLIKATNSKKAAGTVNYILENKLVDQQGQELGKGLKEIITQIPESKQQNFWDYMMHKHSADRFRHGKLVFGGYSDIMSVAKANELLNDNPEFSQLETDVRQFLDKFSDEWLQNSGLITPEARQTLKEMYPNYLPTNRVFNELEKLNDFSGGAKGFVDTGTGLKSAKGSARDIKNPIGTIMNLVNKTVRNARYNQVGQEMINALRENPQKLSEFAEIIPTKQSMIDDINTIMQEEGAEGLALFLDQQYDSVFNKANKGTSNTDNIVTVLENGVPIQVKINNKDLLETLNGMYKSQTGELENIAKKATGVFKSLITQKNPLFAIKNLARDIPTGYVYGSELNPIKYIVELGKAGIDLAKNTDVAKQFKSVGGEISGFFNSTNVEKAINNLTKKNNIFKKTGSAIEYFNNLTESASRLAEFKRVLNKTGDVQKALYASGEITTNFARGGNITKLVDSVVPYLNAGVQGLDKLIRSFIDKPLSTLIKGGVITAPTIALYLLNRDNDDYKQLDNRTKDNYFLIPISDGKFIKVPKSRELGVIFGSLFERIARQIDGDKNAYKGFGNTVATNFSPSNPIENNIFSPIYNLRSNKDFANRNIVPINMLNDGRSPRYQYDEKTSEISKFIGDLLNISPKQMDYLIDAYTGVIGDFMLPIATKGGNAGSVVSKQFIADPAYSNQSINDFYDNLEKLKQLAADNNIKNNIPAKQKTEQEIQRGQFERVSKKITAIYKEISNIQANTNISQALKDLMIRGKRKEIIDLAEKTNQKIK